MAPGTLNCCEQSPSALWDAPCARGTPCSGSTVTCRCCLSMHMAKDSHKILSLISENPQAGHCLLSLHQCLGLCWRLLGFLVQLLRSITELPWDLMLPGTQLLFAGWSSVKALAAGVCVGTTGTLLRRHIARVQPVTDRPVMWGN